MKVWTQSAFVTVRADTKEDAEQAFRRIDGTIVGPEVEVVLDGHPEAELLEDPEDV